MLKFILRKMISKKWLFIALLIGNILLVSIAASNPMYSSAVMQRMLTDELQDYLDEKNAYPGLVSVFFSGTLKRNGEVEGYKEYAQSIPEMYGVPAVMEVARYSLSVALNEPDIERDDARLKSISPSTVEHLEDHVSIVAGRMYSTEIRADGVVEVLVSQKGLTELNLLIGEKRTFTNVLDVNGNPLVVEIVGVFDIADENDIFWVRKPSYFKDEVLMYSEIFKSLFMSGGATNQSVSGTWYELLDYNAMRADNAAHMRDVSAELAAVNKSKSYITITAAFSNIITSHLTVARKVGVTLWVTQVPMYMLLAVFIFMVSRQILEAEQNEIAVLKSRGVKKRQILSLYTIQSLIVALLSLGAGVPLALYITQVIGSANAFLSFVSRRSLPVEISREVIMYGAAAAVFSVATMVLPVFKYTKGSIVTQKQRRHRSDRPVWQRFFLDFIALGVSLYGLYSYNNQREYLYGLILDGAVPDPLLFLCSSLFIIGAGLVAIRLLPLPIALIYRIFRKCWSPAMYASYLKVLREKGNQAFIMVFLVMTIALGVFNSQTARSINKNAEDNTRYLTGADITFTDVWDSNASDVEADPSLDLIYYEPDYNLYSEIDGVVSTAKVYSTSGVSVSVAGGSVKYTTLIAIDTDEFGATCWYDSSLWPTHLYNYLNAISQNARGVLVSTNFRDDYGCKLGDIISYSVNGTSTRGIIYGFVDYFPGYSPYSYRRGSNGKYYESENHLIVANLSQIQDVYGVNIYSVWLKTNDNGDGVYRWIESENKHFSSFSDTNDRIVEEKNEPMLKSLNGVLTLSFIVALALCFIGFLIYWILSIKQRTLLFGIYRAMGMSMREIFTMLINEQLCISVTSVLVGAGVGYLASKLYMPLIQIAYATSDSALPLTNRFSPADMARLGVIVGIMLIVCMCVLVTIIKKMKISQALKLGED